MSKIQQLGRVMREAVIHSSLLRGKYRTKDKANEALSAAITKCSEGSVNEYGLRGCRDAARNMEDVLFGVGGAERLVATLRYFKDRPAIRELSHARHMLTAEEKGNSLSKFYFTKEEQLSALVIDGVRDFLGMFRRTRGFGEKGGGRRKLEDQNAYDAVVSALVSGDLTAARLQRLLSEKMKVSHRQVRRSWALWKNMDDMDSKRWVRKPSAVPKNALRKGELNYSSPFHYISSLIFFFSIHLFRAHCCNC